MSLEDSNLPLLFNHRRKQMRINKIQGIGVNDLRGKVDTANSRSYSIWKDIIRRCYSKEKAKFKCYTKVKVCKEWLLYSNFKKWYDENFPLKLEQEGWEMQIDKDLLSGENKIYSPETCIFLPRKINGFLSNKQSSNTSGITGVSYIKKNNSWVAKIRNFDNHGKIYLGYFSNKNTAGRVYKKARAEQAEKVRDVLRSLRYNKDIIELIK